MHIILYVLDALRADHVGCYGYQRETTPNIDKIAKDGVIFENCFTSTTWTRPVAATILTGVYPAVHQTRTRYDMFSTNLLRIPEVLQQGGYKTAAFATMGNIASEIGFSRGFDKYYDLFREPEILKKRTKLNAAREGLLHTTEDEVALPWAEDIHDFLFPWLEENREENTFSFIWSIETHEPYWTPEGFRPFYGPDIQPGEGESDDIRSADEQDVERLTNMYDNGIFYNDHCLGRLVQHLKDADIYDDTCIILIGDHGEAFYEHQFYAHGKAPYEELIHVPLIIKLPNNKTAGERVSGLSELVDLFPTIAHIGNVSPDHLKDTSLQGYNLLSLLNGNKDSVRDYVFSDTQSLEVHSRYLSVRSDSAKYIQIQTPKRDGNAYLQTAKHVIERGILLDILRRPRHFMKGYFGRDNEMLFDLTQDEKEQNNIAQERPSQIEEFQQILYEWQAQNENLAQQQTAETSEYEESESLRRHLEKLGYL